MKLFTKVGLIYCMAAMTALIMSFTLLFSKEAPVKKINAKLECSYESADSVQYRYPGNGAKVKPRIDGTINCWISIQKIPDGVTLMGKLKANGKAQEAEAIPRPDNTYSADASFSPENGDFETCSAFAVTGELIKAGKTVWKGKLKIDQSCRD
jgi:ABC-type thiamine transport system substrate-binding protein